MQVNLISCLFILDSEKNENIRKNDIKKLKVLTTNENLPSIIYQGKDMKKQVRQNLAHLTGTNKFHLEQVFTLDYKDEVNVIYLGITNIENISKLHKDYQLLDFKVTNNDTITFGKKNYKYKTIEIEENNNIEYVHEVDVRNIAMRKNLINLLISYKKIRSSIDSTDIMFKFMGKSFTLEDVKILYELIKDTTVDKSNFRKKIIKYCEKLDEKSTDKNGFRPSQKYRFKPLKGDIWL